MKAIVKHKSTTVAIKFMREYSLYDHGESVTTVQRPKICHAARTKAITATTYLPHDGMASMPPTIGGGASARMPKHNATNAVSITSKYAPNFTSGKAQQQNRVPLRAMLKKIGSACWVT